MNDVVPDALRRLNEANVIGLAGLTSASLGLKYYHCGYVLPVKRRDNCLIGVVILPAEPPSGGIRWEELEQPGERTFARIISPFVQRYEVEVEVLSHNLCHVVCHCEKQTAFICPHAAALLYQWINRPMTFASWSLPTIEVKSADADEQSFDVLAKHLQNLQNTLVRPAPSLGGTNHASLPSRQQAVNTIGETLAQLGLGELRAVAREYDVGLAGLGKQQLIDTMIETLSKPEAIRHVVATLGKSQRQLLAALALAGGLMSDEDLRGLFERFSLGNSGTLQEMLLALQAKLLVVRTSVNHAQRLSLSLSSLDLSWYIPQEVREALHVTVPITPFAVDVPYGREGNPALPTLHLAKHAHLPADLLLIARALDGFQVEQAEKRQRRSGSLLSGERSSIDGSLALPPPDDQPAPAMIAALRLALPRSSPAFLRFAVRLLSLAHLLDKEGTGITHLRTPSNAAQLLLGPAHRGLLREMFTSWLKSASYAELAELPEHGLRVRCRVTPLNLPDLRPGELEQENNEARQEVLKLLAQVPVGTWINFSAFARFLYRLHPTFLQRRQHLFPAPHWWIEQEEGHPLHPTQQAEWSRAEGRYLPDLIQGPLHWWGMCDLANSKTEQLLAFRLTPLATFFFANNALAARDTQDGIATPPALTISSAGELLIPCQRESWPLIACVERFAEQGGVQEQKLLYRLSARSLGEALSQGCDPHDLLALLSHACSPEGEAVKSQLLTSIERRITNYGRVRLYTNVSLLQVADSSVMQQLSAITSLDQQVMRPLQPNLLLLHKSGATNLLEELKRRGQTPLLHEGEEKLWS